MFYICCFPSDIENKERRVYAVSAYEKAKYVISCFIKSGKQIDVLSPTETNSNERYSEKVYYHDKGFRIISSPTIKKNNIIRRFFSRLYPYLWLYIYLIKNVKRNETICVYHSLKSSFFVNLARLIKGFRIILEVEEIYGNLQIKESHWRNIIERYILKHACGYIFASKQLRDTCNHLCRPYVIINGSYEEKQLYSDKWNDGHLHLVYAGLISKDKAAFQCVEIASFLDAKYRIHIIGYGNEEDIQALLVKIKTSNNENNCKVSYDGMKKGVEYDTFLQKCNLGICPLPADNKYQQACFPSKITSYLSNGLGVITTNNTVIRDSSYKNYVFFVNSNLAYNYAEVIRKIDCSIDNNPMELIKKMNKQLLEEFNKFLSYLD